MANRKPRSEPWSVDRKITFSFHEDGTVGLRAEKAGDNADALFDPSKQSELAAVYAEMHKLNRPIRSASLWLRSDEKGDDGRFLGVPAALSTEYTDKATGEKKEAPFAYTAEQIEDLKAVAFSIKKRWTGYVTVPVLHAYATKAQTDARPAFVRSVKPEAPQTPAAQERGFKRSK